MNSEMMALGARGISIIFARWACACVSDPPVRVLSSLPECLCFYVCLGLRVLPLLLCLLCMCLLYCCCLLARISASSLSSLCGSSGDSSWVKAQKYGSSSPYVTSVGGVFNGELGDDILQVDDISTGGFSSLKENQIQPWQKAAVASWTKQKVIAPYPCICKPSLHTATSPKQSF